MGTLKDTTTASALFGKVRQAVLGLFFEHPEHNYYVREVARLTRAGLGAVQRELRRLTAASILTRSERGGRVWYQANVNGALFPELKGLVAKTTGAANMVREALQPLADRIRVAFVHGSLARDEARPHSDVDVIVIGDVQFAEVVAALRRLQTNLGREINPVAYGEQEFRRKVRAQHHFVTTVLTTPKIFMVGDADELARLAKERLAGSAHHDSGRDRGSSRPGRPRSQGLPSKRP